MKSSGLLQQRIPHFHSISNSVTELADNLRQLGYRICTLENLGAASTASQPIDQQDITLHSILDEIVSKNPGYRWVLDESGLINLFPAQSILDTRVGPSNVKGKTPWEILEEDIQIEKVGLSLFMEFQDDSQRMDFSIKKVSLREALNSLVDQLGNTVWHISGSPGAYYLTLTAVENPR